MIIAARATYRIVARTAATLGCPLPKPLVSTVAEAAATLEAAESFGAATADLNTAAIAALADGRDPSADPNVIALTVRAYLAGPAGITQVASDRAQRVIADALTEHADQILAEWANVLDPHAQALTEAARLLPAGLSDVRTITDRGADALHAWANAQDALKLWNTAAASFRSLAITAGIAVNKTDPLIITAATGDQLAAGPDGIHQLTSDPWQLVRAGIPLRLATITDFMQRRASLSHWKQERNRIAERKRLHDQKVALSA